MAATVWRVCRQCRGRFGLRDPRRVRGEARHAGRFCSHRCRCRWGHAHGWYKASPVASGGKGRAR